MNMLDNAPLPSVAIAQAPVAPVASSDRATQANDFEQMDAPSNLLLQPDESDIRAHINLLVAPIREVCRDRLFELRALDPDKVRPPINRHFPVGEEGVQAATEHAARLNKSGRNIYIGINPRKPGTPLGRAASEKDVYGAFHSFADIDNGSDARETLLGLDLRPTFIVVTGGAHPNTRAHGYWPLPEITEDLGV